MSINKYRLKTKCCLSWIEFNLDEWIFGIYYLVESQLQIIYLKKNLLGSIITHVCAFDPTSQVSLNSHKSFYFYFMFNYR